VGDGLDVLCVPTSERTRAQASRLAIPLSTLDETPELDLCVDGADEFDSARRLIKGGGGALLREKIVACSCRRMIVITDESKQVSTLGAFPLPVEIDRFGARSTQLRVERAALNLGLTGDIHMRKGADGRAFVTDGGHLILDCAFGVIPAPEKLALALKEVPGVVEHGLFIGLATAIIVAGRNGVRTLGETAALA
jgi:ribose 5-phosphate isomerase A